MNLEDVHLNVNLWEKRRKCFGQVVACDSLDGASLLFEPLDHQGDIQGGDIFRTEACFLEPATRGRWEEVYCGPCCFSFDKMCLQPQPTKKANANFRRRTGRTTRMLEHAVQLSNEGKAVYVVAANELDALRLKQQVGPLVRGVKFESADLFPELDWGTMTMLRAWPNVVVLVDHYAIEQRIGAALEMMTRYDLPQVAKEPSESTLLEIDPADAEIRSILGMMCFECGPIADVLRRAGHDIPRKIEMEQSFVMLWLIERYKRHGSGWRDIVNEELRGLAKANKPT